MLGMWRVNMYRFPTWYIPAECLLDRQAQI